MEQNDTLVLYERVLSLLKPRDLHRSSNHVLQDDLSGLQTSVDSVVATFVKVKEVRDAVTQLEQGKASNCCSLGLVDELNRTMQLQETLREKLEKIATGMKVVDHVTLTKKENNKEKQKQTEKKNVQKVKEEKTKKSSLREELTSSLDSDKDKDKEAKRKKQKREATDENKATKTQIESDDRSIAHEALMEISKVTIANKKMQFKSMNTWTMALFDIKRVLKHQSNCNAQTTDKSATEVAARALEAAVAVFKKLEWTAKHTQEAESVIAALTDACSKNKTLQVVFHRVQAQFKSLEMGSPTSLVHSSVNTQPASANSSLEHQLQTYHDLVYNLETQSPGAKVKQIIQALVAIQQVMAGDDLGAHQADVRQSISHVSRWIGETPIQKKLSKEYARFANGISAYSKIFRGKPKRMEWQRLGMNVLTLLDERTNPSQPASTVHLQSGIRQRRKGGKVAPIGNDLQGA